METIEDILGMPRPNDDLAAAGDDKRDLFDILSGLAGLPAPSRAGDDLCDLIETDLIVTDAPPAGWRPDPKDLC